MPIKLTDSEQEAFLWRKKYQKIWSMIDVIFSSIRITLRAEKALRVRPGTRRVVEGQAPKGIVPKSALKLSDGSRCVFLTK